MRGVISRIFGFVAAVRFPRVLQTFINEKYVSGFKIDMSEFKEPIRHLLRARQPRVL